MTGNRPDRDQPEQPERLYRELVEISQGLICKHDLQGTVLYTNPASAHELGFEPHELVGRNLREGLVPSFVHLFDAYLERIREHGTDSGLLRLRARDGSERVWFYRNQLVTEREQEPYVVGHAVDVTDRLRAEALLRKSEERSRAVIAALDEGIVFKTADGTISDCNPSAERILGRPAAELVGLTASDPSWHVVREDGTPFPLEEYPTVTALETGRACSGVVMGVERPDGTLVWIEMNCQPLVDPTRKKPYGVVASFSDVTDRRRREEQREADLRDALAKLRILRGLLPICALCKRIRDDDGTWRQLEVYVQEHSEAEFTHGLCPECVQRYINEAAPQRAPSW